MKLLLDECVPGPIGREFLDHEVSIVDQAGFKGLKNGELLRAASADFDVFISVDKGLEYQHNLQNLPIAILLLSVRSNKLEAVRPLIPKALAVLKSISRRDFIKIEY